MIEPSIHDRIACLANNCAFVNLRRASRDITNYYDKLFLATCGLRATQITPLVVLYLAGPQTVNQIAERLKLDRTTLTRSLRLLEKSSLLEIHPGDDQRTRMVELTDNGTKTLIKVLPVWEEAQNHMEQSIGKKHFSALISQLSNIARLTHKA